MYPDWSIRFRPVAKRPDGSQWIGYVTHSGVERKLEE
jgi:hypothetical protein